MGILDIIIYAMIYTGSALMVFNICAFIMFVRYVKKREQWENKTAILHIPIVLLILFLLGYLAVGIFGSPDLIVSGILFGGSIFVFVMYFLLKGITDRIVEQESLKAELMAAEQSSSAKTRFLASVSHEMRTPMNVIIGLDTVALTEPGLSPKTKENLEKIGLSARHLLSIINSVLDYNDIDSGTLTAKAEPFSLSDAVDQINAIGESLCDVKGLEYVGPAENMQGYYAGDETLIKKVLVELVDNAVKYTDAPGKVVFSVKPHTDEDGEKITFTIMDTGIGIDSQFLPKIFDVFTQEDSSSTSRHSGSGLGLAVIKKMVNIMGGTITVDSVKNVGSTFAVTIPVTVAEAPYSESDADAKNETLEGKRILIVEDLPENAEILADLLDLEDISSERAVNGQVAVEMFSSHPAGYYDAILMDVRMPVMDGLTATETIRALDRPDAKVIPIIAMTANVFDEDVERSLAAGMNAHLSKPIEPEKLYAKMAELIKKA